MILRGDAKQVHNTKKPGVQVVAYLYFQRKSWTSRRKCLLAMEYGLNDWCNSLHMKTCHIQSILFLTDS